MCEHLYRGICGLGWGAGQRRRVEGQVSGYCHGLETVRKGKGPGKWRRGMCQALYRKKTWAVYTMKTSL